MTLSERSSMATSYNSAWSNGEEQSCSESNAPHTGDRKLFRYFWNYYSKESLLFENHPRQQYWLEVVDNVVHLRTSDDADYDIEHDEELMTERDWTEIKRTIIAMRTDDWGMEIPRELSQPAALSRKENVQPEEDEPPSEKCDQIIKTVASTSTTTQPLASTSRA
ncbi:hypothetical protein QAD02_002515 [Eretmocerus hayati]|uniref:Uncharacterized protein n=1 Tax=Eretmocerus hayati TaxID=131215 RepID=A0ACC2NJI9_9HYME|nr:hypothetical protein QAD02_002515 [Eretmocerus hayati]